MNSIQGNSVFLNIGATAFRTPKPTLYGVAHLFSINHFHTSFGTLYWWYNNTNSKEESLRESMKNGRALKGHKRLVAVAGTTKPSHAGTPGGWNAGCMCGWQGGNYPTSKEAYAAYSAHLDHQIDRCMFRCKVCGIEQQASEMRSDYRYMCRVCFSKKGNEWQKKHPTESTKHKRRHHYFRKFGLSIEAVEERVRQQGRACAVCGEPFSDCRGYAPHVDHDHKTGVVRGVLCFRCNAGLGSFKDDVARLRAAIAYLERTVQL